MLYIARRLSGAIGELLLHALQQRGCASSVSLSARMSDERNASLVAWLPLLSARAATVRVVDGALRQPRPN